MCGQVYERLHTRDMRLMGGIRGQFQYLSFFLMFFVAALVGIPGLGNFIGEFLILMGLIRKVPCVHNSCCSKPRICRSVRFNPDSQSIVWYTKRSAKTALRKSIERLKCT